MLTQSKQTNRINLYILTVNVVPFDQSFSLAKYVNSYKENQHTGNNEVANM